MPYHYFMAVMLLSYYRCGCQPLDPTVAFSVSVIGRATILYTAARAIEHETRQVYPIPAPILRVRSIRAGQDTRKMDLLFL